jgi:hypothetical protein
VCADRVGLWPGPGWGWLGAGQRQLGGKRAGAARAAQPSQGPAAALGLGARASPGGQAAAARRISAGLAGQDRRRGGRRVCRAAAARRSVIRSAPRGVPRPFRPRIDGQGAKNHPVWLTYELPRNARIEFDAVSSSSDGDIKAEFWGDGRSAATGASYNDATGYIAIYGGWHNRYHVLARRDEHAPDRLQVAVSEGSQDYRARPVQPHRSYHFKVERNDGKTVQWLVEDIEIHVFADPDPLVGPGHEHFGFNNWATAVCFDNVMITPLPDE